MTFTDRGATVAVSIALLATVVTQLFYIGVVTPQDSAILRKITWTSELVLFSAVVWLSMPLAARSAMPLVWSAVAVSGLLNVVQVGMGLLEFPQAQQATDPAVFQTVLNGAFFLYFHAKLMMGVAAVALGFAAWQAAPAVGKSLGALSSVAGLVAIALNLHGVANGMSQVFAAGAAGTVATALFAITALVAAREGQ